MSGLQVPHYDDNFQYEVDMKELRRRDGCQVNGTKAAVSQRQVTDSIT